MKSAKQKSLPTRLRRARTLLMAWSRAVRDSHTERGGPLNGRVTDAGALRELDDFAEATQALTEAIKLARMEQPSRRGGGLTQCDMHEDESL
jgi:hypothetical protein